MAVPKKGEGWGLVGCSKEEQVQGRGQGRVGLAVGGGARASVAGVSGRDTGPRDGANFATCVVFLSFLTRTKRRKMAFFEGALWGGGGVPTGAGLVDGGVDQGPWLQERVGGGVGAMAVPKKGEGWGLVGCSKEEQVRNQVRTVVSEPSLENSTQ